MGSALVFLGCDNKVPWTEWLKQQKYISSVLEARSLRSRCQQG